MTQKYFTLVGSRQTSQDSQIILRELSKQLLKLGYIGRSGAAKGADECLEVASFVTGIPNVEIYLPWGGFQERVADDIHYINAQTLSNYEQARILAAQIHGGFRYCSFGAKSLHTRNVYQVLGRDLSTPSDLVVCCAPPDTSGKGVIGGTRTAVKLAKNLNIPTLNVYGLCEEDSREKLNSIIMLIDMIK